MKETLAEPQLPGKRPWNFPFPPAAWPFFTHPNKKALSQPWIHEGALVFSNGFLALQVDRFELAHDMPDQAPPEFLERWNRAPWQRFESIQDAPDWRPLDDAALLLWKFGPKPIWEKGSKQYHIRTAPLVGVGLAAVTLLPLVQLCARLPRAEAYTRSQHREPVFIRFNGGRAILASFDDTVSPLPFSILNPRRDPLEGRGMNKPI